MDMFVHCPSSLNISTYSKNCITREARLPSAQSHSCCSPGGALLVHTISIRPAQCITPPSSLAVAMLQLQSLAAQATSACKVLSCQIIIKIYIQPAKDPALATERMLGPGWAYEISCRCHRGFPMRGHRARPHKLQGSQRGYIHTLRSICTSPLGQRHLAGLGAVAGLDGQKVARRMGKQNIL